MRKKILLLLAAFLLLLPSVALANAPAPDPTVHTVTIGPDYMEREISVQVREEGTDFQTVLTETVSKGESASLVFHTPVSDTCTIRIVEKLEDGTERVSNETECRSRMDFQYDPETRVLSEKQKSSGIGSSLLGVLLMVLYLGAASFVFPLGWTLLSEYLTAIPFGIRPRGFILLVNLISNLAMNILLGILETVLFAVTIKTEAALGAAWQHYVIVGILEIIVVWAEYSVYRKHYQTYSSRRLLQYTILANAGSWFGIELIRALL